MKGWTKRLTQGSKEYTPSYEDLRDIYIFLRSTQRLLYRAEEQDIVAQIEYVFSKKGFGNVQTLQEIVAQLAESGLGPEVSYRDKQIHLDLLKPKRKETQEEKTAKRYLEAGARLTRGRNWQYRLEVAINEAVAAKWFPMFGTYTVDPKRLPKGCLTRNELWTKTAAWDRFVKKIKTDVAEACGHGRKPAKWPKGETFLKYFAVIEHGSSGEHPHVHVIWLCRKIPALWRIDPNRNCPTQTATDMPAASALWEHGIQRRTIALFITGSWFTQNWLLPRKSKEIPGKVGDASAVAGYLGKYLTKGDTKKWKHRVKATKNLGMTKLKKALQHTKSLSLLLTLASRSPKYANGLKLQMNSAPPLSLIREKSKQVLTKRLHSLKTARARDFLRVQWTKKRGEFFMHYIRTARDGQRPWSLTPGQRYNCYTLMLEEVSSTGQSKPRLQEALKWICYNVGKRTNSTPYTLLKGEAI